MTPQPTPGEPLNGESVRLLLPGDRLRFMDGSDVRCEGIGDHESVTFSRFDGYARTGRHYSAFTFVSRPQPSAGQEGGGETKAALSPGHTDLMISPEAIDEFLAAGDHPEIASPATATGWPSREVEEALRGALEWDKARGYRMPYRVRDPIYTALDKLALFPRPEDEGAE